MAAVAAETALPREVASRESELPRLNGPIHLVVPLVRSMRSKAFAGNIHIVSAEITAGITFVSTDAFRECVNLRTVTLPEGIESIDGSAFRFCRNLREIVLPSVSPCHPSPATTTAAQGPAVRSRLIPCVARPLETYLRGWVSRAQPRVL